MAYENVNELANGLHKAKLELDVITRYLEEEFEKTESNDIVNFRKLIKRIQKLQKSADTLEDDGSKIKKAMYSIINNSDQLIENWNTLECLRQISGLPLMGDDDGAIDDLKNTVSEWKNKNNIENQKQND